MLCTLIDIYVLITNEIEQVLLNWMYLMQFIPETW
jgi:hypothetical protein